MPVAFLFVPLPQKAPVPPLIACRPPIRAARWRGGVNPETFEVTADGEKLTCELEPLRDGPILLDRFCWRGSAADWTEGQNRRDWMEGTMRAETAEPGVDP